MQVEVKLNEATRSIAGLYSLNMTVLGHGLYTAFTITTSFPISIVGRYTTHILYILHIPYNIFLVNNSCCFLQPDISAETRGVFVTVLEGDSSVAAVRITEYSGVNLVNVTALNWNPKLPPSISASSPTKLCVISV